MPGPQEGDEQKQLGMERKTRGEEVKSPEQIYHNQMRKGGMGRVQFPEDKKLGEERNLGKKVKRYGGEGFSRTSSSKACQDIKVMGKDKSRRLRRERGRKGRERGCQARSQEWSSPSLVGKP